MIRRVFPSLPGPNFSTRVGGHASRAGFIPVTRINIWIQYLLPHHLLTAAAGALAHWRFKPWKRFVIATFCRVYRPRLAEARQSDKNAYDHFNGFFTRALKPGTRPLPEDRSFALSPVDGTLSRCGRLEAGTLIQAKGLHYAAETLLASAEWAGAFAGGAFLTAYLSPADYHRVHMPVDGRLIATAFVPGRLFSVAPFTVGAIPKLFCRNERLVCLFETPAGLMAQVLVGAMLVGGIETVWHGPWGHGAELTRREYDRDNVALPRGAEMGRFNYGSTVIVMFQPGRLCLREDLEYGAALRMGEPIGRLAMA